MNENFECQCCRRLIPGGSLGGYIGVGSVAAVCLSCYRIYMSVGVAYPDKTMPECLDTTRLICALEALSAAEKQKLRKLVFLVRNNSLRAERLSGMATDGRISFSQLLAII